MYGNQRLLRVCKRFLLVVDIFLGAALCRAQVPTASASSMPASIQDRAMVGNLPLSPTAIQVAREVNAFAPIEKLGSLSVSDRCGGAATLQALTLRQEVTEKVAAASLEIDGFFAGIDSETTQIRIALARLESRRDSALKFNNIGGIVAGTGLGIVASALELKSGTAIAGDWVGVGSGALATGLSFLAFPLAKVWSGCFPDVREPGELGRAPKCPKLKPSQSESLGREGLPSVGEDVCTEKPETPGCSPRMLYRLLFPRGTPGGEQAAGFYSEYPQSVAAYLADTPPGGIASRRSRLVAAWEEEDNAKAGKWLVTGNADRRRLSIDNLNDRVDKLADLRSRVSIMKRDLGLVISEVNEGLRCPGE